MRRAVLALVFALANLIALEQAPSNVRLNAPDIVGATCTPNVSVGTTAAQLQTAINNASDGDTLCFEDGSYTLGGVGTINLSNSKGVTFACESTWGCDVEVNDALFFLTVVGTNVKAYRFARFDFINCDETIFKTQSTSSSAEATLSSLRFDHNRFNGVTTTIIQLGTGGGGGAVYHYGVFDHNEVYMTNQARFFYFRGDQDDSPPASPTGTGNNFFIEDNLFDVTTVTASAVSTGFIDSEANGAVVTRFNTFRNVYQGTHGVPAAGGSSNFEWYGNQMTYDNGDSPTSGINDGDWGTHHQGSGVILYWGNRVTLSPAEGHSSNFFVVQHYRDFQASPTTIGSGDSTCTGSATGDGNRSPEATYRGYPCWRQPGRDFAANLFPMYTWSNRYTDNNAQINIAMSNGGGFFAEHFVSNRDYYSEVAGAGSTGVLVGTSNSGVACTAEADAADAGDGGEGYFDTDAGSWNASSSNPYGVQQNGADGVLYHCSATDTWSVLYTPYTYPHPLNN